MKLSKHFELAELTASQYLLCLLVGRYQTLVVGYHQGGA